jgi:hypothetical protein
MIPIVTNHLDRKMISDNDFWSGKSEIRLDIGAMIRVVRRVYAL